MSKVLDLGVISSFQTLLTALCILPLFIREVRDLCRQSKKKVRFSWYKGVSSVPTHRADGPGVQDSDQYFDWSLKAFQHWIILFHTLLHCVPYCVIYNLHCGLVVKILVGDSKHVLNYFYSNILVSWNALWSCDFCE